MLPGVSSLRTKTSAVRPLLKRSILSSQRRLAAVETCYSAFLAWEHSQSPGLLAGKATLKFEEQLQIWVDGLDFSNTFERLEKPELGWYESFWGGLSGIHHRLDSSASVISGNIPRAVQYPSSFRL